jgi:multiple sugar transport system ATP-binding protein
MTMADEMVVMRDGNIEQIGGPLDVYDHPENIFVAGFIGSPAMNLLGGQIRRANGAADVIMDDGTLLPITAANGAENGRPVVCGIRPEHFELVGEGDGLPAEVAVIEPTGAETIVVCRFAGMEIQVLFKERHALTLGQTIPLRPRPGSAHLFDRESGARMS